MTYRLKCNDEVSISFMTRHIVLCTTKEIGNVAETCLETKCGAFSFLTLHLCCNIMHTWAL